MANNEEEYLEKRVRGLMEPLMASMEEAKPKEPVCFIILK
jgi:hypothetical protein